MGVKTTLSIKGLLVKVKANTDLTWDDDAVNLVSGRILRLRCMRGELRIEHEYRLQARWLGGGWKGSEMIRALL